jgi:hypothetical protein
MQCWTIRLPFVASEWLLRLGVMESLTNCCTLANLEPSDRNLLASGSGHERFYTLLRIRVSLLAASRCRWPLCCRCFGCTSIGRKECQS